MTPRVCVKPNGFIDSWAVVIVGEKGKRLRILETGCTRWKSDELARRYRALGPEKLNALVSAKAPKPC